MRGGSQALRRANQTLGGAIRSAASRHFTINPAHGASAANNLLGITSDFVGARAHQSLRELDQMLLDDEAPFFASEAMALAAQQRRLNRGDPTAVSRLGATWTLTSHSAMHASRDEAARVVERTARSGRDLVVVPRGPGFVVLDKSVADSVAALGEAASEAA